MTSGFVWRFVYWSACAVLIGWAYRLGRRALGALGAAARSDGALMAEILVLRQGNAVLRRQIARVRYEPADRAWFAALSGLIPRRSGPTWTQFPAAHARNLAMTLEERLAEPGACPTPTRISPP